MRLLILLMVLLVVFIVLRIIGNKRDLLIPEMIGICGTISSFLFLVSFLLVIGYVSSGIPYHKTFSEKLSLEYRIEHKVDFVDNTLYRDIYNYNEEIRRNKKYCNNKWVGFLYDEKIAELNYISIEKE